MPLRSVGLSLLLQHHKRQKFCCTELKTCQVTAADRALTGAHTSAGHWNQLGTEFSWAEHGEQLCSLATQKASPGSLTTGMSD